MRFSGMPTPSVAYIQSKHFNCLTLEKKSSKLICSTTEKIKIHDSMSMPMPDLGLSITNENLCIRPTTSTKYIRIVNFDFKITYAPYPHIMISNEKQTVIVTISLA